MTRSNYNNSTVARALARIQLKRKLLETAECPSTRRQLAARKARALEEFQCASKRNTELQDAITKALKSLECPHADGESENDEELLNAIRQQYNVVVKAMYPSWWKEAKQIAQSTSKARFMAPDSVERHSSDLATNRHEANLSHGMDGKENLEAAYVHTVQFYNPLRSGILAAVDRPSRPGSPDRGSACSTSPRASPVWRPTKPRKPPSLSPEPSTHQHFKQPDGLLQDWTMDPPFPHQQCQDEYTDADFNHNHQSPTWTLTPPQDPHSISARAVQTTVAGIPTHLLGHTSGMAGSTSLHGYDPSSWYGDFQQSSWAYNPTFYASPANMHPALHCRTNGQINSIPLHLNMTASASSSLAYLDAVAVRSVETSPSPTCAVGIPVVSPPHPHASLMAPAAVSSLVPVYVDASPRGYNSQATSATLLSDNHHLVHTLPVHAQHGTNSRAATGNSTFEVANPQAYPKGMPSAPLEEPVPHQASRASPRNEGSTQQHAGTADTALTSSSRANHTVKGEPSGTETGSAKLLVNHPPPSNQNESRQEGTRRQTWQNIPEQSSNEGSGPSYHPGANAELLSSSNRPENWNQTGANGIGKAKPVFESAKFWHPASQVFATPEPQTEQEPSFRELAPESSGDSGHQKPFSSRNTKHQPASSIHPHATPTMQPLVQHNAAHMQPQVQPHQVQHNTIMPPALPISQPVNHEPRTLPQQTSRGLESTTHHHQNQPSNWQFNSTPRPSPGAAPTATQDVLASVFVDTDSARSTPIPSESPTPRRLSNTSDISNTAAGNPSSQLKSSSGTRTLENSHQPADSHSNNESRQTGPSSLKNVVPMKKDQHELGTTYMGKDRHLDGSDTTAVQGYRKVHGSLDEPVTGLADEGNAIIPGSAQGSARQSSSGVQSKVIPPRTASTGISSAFDDAGLTLTSTMMQPAWGSARGAVEAALTTLGAVKSEQSSFGDAGHGVKEGTRTHALTSGSTHEPAAPAPKSLISTLAAEDTETGSESYSLRDEISSGYLSLATDTSITPSIDPTITSASGALNQRHQKQTSHPAVPRLNLSNGVALPAGSHNPGHDLAGLQNPGHDLAGLQNLGRDLAVLQNPGHNLAGPQNPGHDTAAGVATCNANNHGGNDTGRSAEHSAKSSSRGSRPTITALSMDVQAEALQRTSMTGVPVVVMTTTLDGNLLSPNSARQAQASWTYGSPTPSSPSTPKPNTTTSPTSKPTSPSTTNDISPTMNSSNSVTARSNAHQSTSSMNANQSTSSMNANQSTSSMNANQSTSSRQNRVASILSKTLALGGSSEFESESDNGSECEGGGDEQIGKEASSTGMGLINQMLALSLTEGGQQGSPSQRAKQSFSAKVEPQEEGSHDEFDF